MAIPRIPPNEGHGALLWPPTANLADDMMVYRADWREDAATAADAYKRWSDAPRDEKAERFAAYLAALEQEEAAATTYAEAVATTQRWLQSADR